MADHNYFANLIWQIADLLRGPYRPPQYERGPLIGAWSGWSWTFPTKEEHATSTTVIARDRIVMARSIVRAVELLRPGDEVYIRAWKVRLMSMSIGEELRDARIARGLTVEQVSALTKISPRIVRAIEADDLQ